MNDAAIFRQVRRRQLTAQLTGHLRRRIVAGDLGFDRQLPPMRRLAKMYGVSLPTVYAAIHALAELGFVRIAWGVGVFVRRPRSHAAVLDHAWRDATTEELAMLRAALDERLPLLAARAVRGIPSRRATRNAADLMLFARERSASGRWPYAGPFVDADLAFHRAIARLPTGAEGAPTLLDWVGRRLRPTLLAAAQAHAADDRLDTEHLALAEAIVGGDIMRAGRSGRFVARREVRAITGTLG